MRYVQAAVAAVLACVLFSVSAVAQNGAVKIGVLDDMSGPYAEATVWAMCWQRGSRSRISSNRIPTLAWN